MALLLARLKSRWQSQGLEISAAAELTAFDVSAPEVLDSSRLETAVQTKPVSSTDFRLVLRRTVWRRCRQGKTMEGVEMLVFELGNHSECFTRAQRWWKAFTS
jgi:hypothetical protein